MKKESIQLYKTFKQSQRDIKQQYIEQQSTILRFSTTSQNLQKNNSMRFIQQSQNYNQKLNLSQKNNNNNNLSNGMRLSIMSNKKQDQEKQKNCKNIQIINNSKKNIYQKRASNTLYPKDKNKKSYHHSFQKSNQTLEYFSPKKVIVAFNINNNRLKKCKSKKKFYQINRINSNINVNLNTQQCQQQQYKGNLHTNEKNDKNNEQSSIKKFRNQQKNRKLIFDSIGTQFGLDIKQVQYDNSNQLNQKVSIFRDKLVKKLRTSIQLNKTIKKKSQKCKTLIDDQFSINIKNNNIQIKKKYSYILSSQLQKKLNNNTVQSRYIRMRQFFELILMSYNCILAIPQVQRLSFLKMNRQGYSNRKYLYFIGKGNNSNLLRTLMKKRWWWIQTQDINEADFVWTQLRVDNINNKKLQIIQSIQQSHLTSNTFSFSKNRYKNIYAKNNQDINTINISKKNRQLLHYFKINGIQKIFHSSYLQKLSHENSFDKILFKKISPVQIHHNHYPLNFMFGNKKALFANLKQYCNYKSENILNFIPLTFYIQNVEKDSWKQFEKYFKLNQNKNKNALWIVKPGQNSNRGQGIFISNCLKKIKFAIKSSKNHTYIIQKYIKNIFLFQKRKFDIRTYMLAVTFGGVYKYYWYNQGYLRTSSEIYDINDFYDPMIHLTNDAIQNKGDNYGKFEDGNKISFHQFQRYLNINYLKQKYQINQLIKKMKQICKKVVEATYNKIGKKQHGFQLFGLDFLIDNNFQPLLLQVNTNPCLQLSSNNLQRLIPRMLDNALRIALDPLYGISYQCPRSFMNLISDQFIQRNRFQLIFDSLYDRNYDWQYKCNLNSSSNVFYEDDNQQFDGDGNIIAIDNI